MSRDAVDLGKDRNNAVELCRVPLDKRRSGRPRPSCKKRCGRIVADLGSSGGIFGGFRFHEDDSFIQIMGHWRLLEQLESSGLRCTRSVDETKLMRGGQ